MKTKPFTINSGKYEGWKCYGPYYRTRHGKHASFYVLRKDNERIQVDEDNLEDELPAITQNTKPFIDWITWNEDKVSS